MASSSNQSQQPPQQQPINYSADAPTTTSSSTISKPSVVFDENLFHFLPRLGDILKSFDKNPNEFKTKLDELRKQFESCQDMISRVEGIDTTLDEQRSELERLDNELKSKTDLLKKHIQMCKFDLNMPRKTHRRLTSETEEDSGSHSLQNPTNAMNVNDDDDDDLFQSDDHHPNLHQENLSSFFS